MIRKLLLSLLFLLGFTCVAFAVCGTGAGTCFWIGGTGTWDNSTTTHWSDTSGGTQTAGTPPASTSPVTFDGSSGGGTVTVAATINGSNTLASLATGLFTGTLDFSANNPNISMGTWSPTGAATKTVNMGTGTFTFTATTGTVVDCSACSNMTFSAGTSNFKFAATPTGARTFIWGFGKTLATVEIANTGSGSTGAAYPLVMNGAVPITTLTMTNCPIMTIASGSSITVTNGFSWNGTSSNPIYLRGDSNGGLPSTFTANGAVTMSWAGVYIITKAGAGSIAATNSFDLGGNTGVTITAPSSTQGGRVIGGYLFRRDLSNGDNDNYPAFLNKVS